MGAKTKIEWCDTTWSPVTGCLHECEYCYARGIARRFSQRKGCSVVTGDGADIKFLGNGWVPAANGSGVEFEFPVWFQDEETGDKVARCPYPMVFKPTLHRYRLDIPAHWREPRNIFVCSMADLFGAWVPDSWIQAVFKACEAAPWHNYLFLTKNPKRYLELGLSGKVPDKANFWFGSTTTAPKSEFAYITDANCHTFVSIEPLLYGGWEIASSAEWPEWVIIGAMSGPGSKQHQPKAEWVADIVAQCREAGVPVFMKDSLVPVVGEGNMLRELPRGLRK